MGEEPHSVRNPRPSLPIGAQQIKDSRRSTASPSKPPPSSDSRQRFGLDFGLTDDSRILASWLSASQSRRDTSRATQPALGWHLSPPISSPLLTEAIQIHLGDRSSDEVQHLPQLSLVGSLKRKHLRIYSHGPQESPNSTVKTPKFSPVLAPCQG